MAFGKIMLTIALFLALTGISQAFEIDGDDTFYVSGGEKIESAFIIYGAEGDYLLKTDFPFISFEENKYVNSKVVNQGNYVTNGAFLVKYYITIPENVDVNIHRTTISVSDTKDTKYVNVKISVQKGLFRGLFSFLSKPMSWVYVISILSLMFIIGLIINFPRGRKP